MFFTQETMNRLKIFFVFLFSLLVLPNLGTKPLWQDEAETALVARQMVKTNTWLPYAFDDQGPISQDWNYQFKVSPLWRWHPWLQFYVTALSFKLLGVSAFAARLPFALIGTAAYWYFLNFLTKHSPSLRGAKRRGNLAFFLTAAILFLLSTPLLLHLRQSRYYSLSLFFTLLTIDGYLDMQRSLLAAEQGDSSKFPQFSPRRPHATTFFPNKDCPCCARTVLKKHQTIYYRFLNHASLHPPLGHLAQNRRPKPQFFAGINQTTPNPTLSIYPQIHLPRPHPYPHNISELTKKIFPRRQTYSFLNFHLNFPSLIYIQPPILFPLPGAAYTILYIYRRLDYRHRQANLGHYPPNFPYPNNRQNFSEISA